MIRYRSAQWSGVRTMVKSLSARHIPVDELKIIDPFLKTFTNINKLEDLERNNTQDPESYTSDPF
jgi:hypothetical protein